MVELVPIKDDNKHYYLKFEKQYEGNLNKYLSRIYPYHHEEYERLIQRNMLAWFYIAADKEFIGSVWLEKLSEESKSAVLGVFIAESRFRGVGIGENVLREIIKQGGRMLDIKQIELNVRINNVRAIACYKKCGFIEVECYTNKNDMKVIHMSYKLD